MTKASRLSPTRLLWAFCAFLLLFPSGAQTLTAPRSLEGLDDEDREALESIASRDEALRDAALLASQHVDMLVEVQRIQQQSSDRFREAIEGQPDDVQEMIWDVVQVPGLLEEIGTGGPHSGSELDAIASRHPERLGAAIRTLGRGHYGLLGEILRIDQVSWDRFETLTDELPEASQQALRSLVDEPELLSILVRRVRLTVYLGDSYREDPAATRRHLAELGAEVAQRETAAEEEWRSAMASDGEAAAELERSARLYADEYDYDYDDLTRYETVTTIRTEVHHYPYWFGYPSRYADHYLYPYGYWNAYPVHLGFYFGGGHNGHHRVHFGVPSRHYLHWYFGNHHDRHYKHLSHRFSRHHDTHRHARDHRYRTLSHWNRHKGNRDRHGDWHRGKRHSQRDRHGAREQQRGDDRRHGRHFFRDHQRRRDGERGHFAPDRKRHDRRDGEHAKRRDRDRRRDADERARPRRHERRDTRRDARHDEGRRDARRGESRRDDRPDARQGESRRDDRRDARHGESRRDARRSRPEREATQHSSKRERKAEARRQRVPRETRSAPQRPQKAREFREARAPAREARQVRKASRSERPAKSLRKAAKRTQRQVQAPRRSERQARKASQHSSGKTRSARASGRSHKASRSGNSGAGGKHRQGGRH